VDDSRQRLGSPSGTATALPRPFLGGRSSWCPSRRIRSQVGGPQAARTTLGPLRDPRLRCNSGRHRLGNQNHHVPANASRCCHPRMDCHPQAASSTTIKNPIPLPMPVCDPTPKIISHRTFRGRAAPHAGASAASSPAAADRLAPPASPLSSSNRHPESR
jgi:hypothetical protein